LDTIWKQHKKQVLLSFVESKGAFGELQLLR